MPSYPVIGIAGPARSGKDTLANFVIATRMYGYRYGFADPIKRMLLPLNIDMTDPFWTAHKEDVIPALGVSVRQLMQTLGTEWGRQLVNPEIWVILAKQALLDNGPGMVVPDVRFENEAHWIRSLGGAVVHLHRGVRPLVREHVSESGVASVDGDFHIYNDGTLEQLQATVQEMFSDGPRS